MFNTIRKFTLVSMLLVMSLQATAQTYVAVAIDESGDWAWAREASEVDAQRAALNYCNEGGKKKCIIAYHTALVIAESKSGQGVGFGISQKPLFEIHEKALKACGQSDCTVVESITEPGFLAIAQSNTDPKFMGWAYGHNDPDEANDAAMRACNEGKNGGECTIFSMGAIRGDLDAAKALNKPSGSTQPKSCRPNTNPITCTSNCVNGNCKVTYENGCVIEVTVQPKYDPFNNAWTYPSPQC